MAVCSTAIDSILTIPSLPTSDQVTADDLQVMLSFTETSNLCEWINIPEEGTICGMRFETLDSFLTHIRSHISLLSKPGVCQWNLCRYSCTHPIEFTSHVLFHGHHSNLKCKGEEFSDFKCLPACQLGSELVNDVPKVEEGWKCLWEESDECCGKVFDCVNIYYDHVKEHVEKMEKSKCGWKDCSIQCSTRWKLRDHVRTHTQEKLIACPQCGALFSNNTKFQDHLNRQFIPADSPHCCTICSKRFTSDRLLKQHVRKHVNTQKCPYCAMTCTSRSSLTYHIAYRHSRGKPHECPLCQKKYKTQYSLSDHLESHQDRVIPCLQQGCAFTTNSMRSYRQHLRLEHTNESIFCCHVCNKKYPLGSKLTEHLKKIHGFSLPPGHSRFRYIKGDDGMKRLQTVRLDDKSITTTSNNEHL